MAQKLSLGILCVWWLGGWCWPQAPDCAFAARSGALRGRHCLLRGEPEAGTPCGTLVEVGCAEVIALLPGQGSAPVTATEALGRSCQVAFPRKSLHVSSGDPVKAAVGGPDSGRF